MGTGTGGTLIIGFAAVAAAQEEVVVVAYRGSEPGGDVPASVTTLDADDIGAGRPGLELGEALAAVPGVTVTNRTNFAQDTRLSIRGFGARSAFGIRGVRLVLDGVPLTLPDGQSQVDSLALANIGRIEVLRGPAGALYGNSAGGVVLLETIRAPDAPELVSTTVLGSFGLFEQSVAARAKTSDGEVTTFVGRTAMRGWRAQSAVEQWVAQGRYSARVSEGIEVSGVVHWVRAPTGDDPGGLTAGEAAADPAQASPTSLAFDTGESVSQLQAGQRVVISPSPAHRVELVGHVGVRSFDANIPSSVVRFDRDFWGALAQWRWRQGVSALAIGGELQGQRDDRENFANVDGLPDGAATLDQRERASNVGLYAQERLAVGRAVILASGRYDRVAFSVLDRVLADGDISGDRVFDRATGQGGVLVRVADGAVAYANVSQSFETPTLTELVNSSGDGGLDPELRPQVGLSTEVGARWSGPRHALDVAAYRVGLQGELVAAEDDQGRVTYTNAGRSDRLGAEILGRVTPVDGVELLGTWTWIRARFRDDRDGLAIPGIPEHRGFVRVQAERRGAHGAIEAELVGAIPATDDNTVRADAYALVGARLGYTLRALPAVEVDLTLSLRNATNAAYTDNVRINAFGDRYFEPGPPRSVYGALTIRPNRGSLL